MASASEDDELLSILLVNLRNAGATFGEGSPPYETIRTTLEEHLQAMKARGSGTNIAATRSNHPKKDESAGVTATPQMFASLAFRPKPS